MSMGAVLHPATLQDRELRSWADRSGKATERARSDGNGPTYLARDSRRAALRSHMPDTIRILMQHLAYSFVVQFARLCPGALRHIVVTRAQRGQVADLVRLRVGSVSVAAACRWGSTVRRSSRRAHFPRRGMVRLFVCGKASAVRGVPGGDPTSAGSRARVFCRIDLTDDRNGLLSFSAGIVVVLVGGHVVMIGGGQPMQLESRPAYLPMKD